MPETGDIAPEFTLPTPHGPFSLAEQRPAPVVLYFYPKDDTSGCTREALDFTAQKADFDALGVRILGVSKDSVRKHANFSAKHDLNVALGSDEDGAVCEAYGVWVEKKMYGRSFMGVERATFLIDAEGRIARLWRKVKVPGHVDDVLDAAREL